MSTDANKAVLRGTMRIWNDSELAAAAEYYASECTVNGRPMGPEQIGQFVGMLFGAFPDMHFHEEHLVAEEDMVAACYTWTGTHRGDYHTPGGVVPPTGKSFRVTGNEFFRLRDGKIVACIAVWDHLAMLQQLGVIPAPQRATG